MVSDAEILEKFKINRSGGMKELFGRYYRPLVLYADEFVRSVSVAEDIVQEFFVRLWTEEYMDHLSSRALPSYLFTSVRNACYTYGHAKNVWNYSEVLGPEIDVPMETAMEMDDEMAEKVNMAIDRLPNQTRKVVILVLVKDMKYKEAAEELKISVNTLKTLLGNGIKKLKDELQDDFYSLVFWVYCVRYVGRMPDNIKGYG